MLSPHCSPANPLLLDMEMLLPFPSKPQGQGHPSPTRGQGGSTALSWSLAPGQDRRADLKADGGLAVLHGSGTGTVLCFNPSTWISPGSTSVDFSRFCGH